MNTISDLFPERGPDASPGVVAVAVPVALERTYSYRVPRGLKVEPGAIVVVPLGPRKIIGVVWDEAGDEA